MSKTLERVLALTAARNVRLSAHGYDELVEDGIFFADVLEGIKNAVLIEDYPSASKGPSVLVLQHAMD